MKLKDKTAVIVGATGGMGSVIAKKLDKHGVQCILVAKSKRELKKLKKTLQDKDHVLYTADLSKYEKTWSLARRISKRFKKIDILFNAAGIGIYRDIKTITKKDWDKSMMLNVTAPMLFIKGLLPSLQRSEKSYVINFGSGCGKEPYANRIEYNTSKFALRGLSLSLSKDLKNPRVVLFTLGSVMTNFGPGGKEKRKRLEKKGKEYLKPEWVANKMIRTIKNGDFEREISFYPSHYRLEAKKSKS